MGQKFAAYDASIAGQIVGFYDSIDSPPPGDVTVTEITDEQWQACLANPGGFVIQNDALVDAPIDPAAALANAQSARLAMLASMCQAQIVGGFTSSALGTSTNYPSQSTDQSNLQSAVQAAVSSAAVAGWTTPLWCEQGGVWGFTAHTASQVQQVNVDWVTFRSAAQAQYATAVGQVNNATTVDAVQAISEAA
jgi:hypothetical protein